MKLVSFLEQYPVSYSRILTAKGRKRILLKNPNYAPPYKYLLDWINSVIPRLIDQKYRLSTKCYWILNGLTDFPKCACSGCEYKFIDHNVEMNQGYPTFCVKHSRSNSISAKKRLETNKFRFGTDYAMQAEIIKQRVANTNLAKIGYKTPLASPIHRTLGMQTKLERYGDENYSNRDKASETYKRHSEDSEFSPKVRQKAINTNIRNGHTGNWTNRELAGKTRRENNCGAYWTDYMLEKSKTTLEYHRLDDPDFDIKRRTKTENTVFKKYGVKCALQTDTAKTALQNWILDHGGNNNAFQTNEAKRKSRETMMQKYGVEYAMQSSEIRNKFDFKNISEKCSETKRQNRTFNQSRPEDECFWILKFIHPHIKRQYRSAEYPFACDFYDPDSGTYFEFNGTWTHGGGFFNSYSKEDQAKLKLWLEKSKTSKFYENAIRTWTIMDVKKLQTAKMNGLKYVVFWNINEARKYVQDQKNSD